MRFNIRCKLMVAIAAMAFAQPGHAGTQTDCIAANLPAATSKAAIDSYLEGGFSQMKSPSPAVTIRLWQACLPKGTTGKEEITRRFAILIAAHLSMKAGEGALLQRHGLSLARIDSAWAGLAPVHRGRFLRGGKSDEASTLAMIAFAGALRPDISKATLDLLRGPLGNDSPIRALLPFVVDATVYGISRGLLETDR